jgi:hypothetical protein
MSGRKIESQKEILGLRARRTYGDGGLKDLHSAEALFPEAPVVAAAGRHVANGKLARVQRAQVRHQLCQLDRADTAQTSTGEQEYLTQ